MVSLQRRVPNIHVRRCLLAIRESLLPPLLSSKFFENIDWFCGRLNYVWIHQGGRQAALPAPTYIDYVMTSIQNLIDDEKIFPTKSSMCSHYIFIYGLMD